MLQLQMAQAATLAVISAAFDLAKDASSTGSSCNLSHH
jgi:hypothetical protein